MSDDVLAEIRKRHAACEEHGPGCAMGGVMNAHEDRATLLRLIDEAAPQPISTVPKDETVVLVWYAPDKIWEPRAFNGREENRSMYYSHWMPMPRSPRG
jgi:hypothetical protein